jgi:hypothetical protein
VCPGAALAGVALDPIGRGGHVPAVLVERAIGLDLIAEAAPLQATRPVIVCPLGFEVPPCLRRPGAVIVIRHGIRVGRP